MVPGHGFAEPFGALIFFEDFLSLFLPSISSKQVADDSHNEVISDKNKAEHSSASLAIIASAGNTQQQCQHGSRTPQIDRQNVKVDTSSDDSVSTINHPASTTTLSQNETRRFIRQEMLGFGVESGQRGSVQSLLAAFIVDTVFCRLDDVSSHGKSTLDELCRPPPRENSLNQELDPTNFYSMKQQNQMVSCLG